VVYRHLTTWRKVVGPTDANSAENETKHLLFSGRKYGEDVSEGDLLENRIKPLPIRNPNPRAKHRGTTPTSRRVKRVSIVKNLVDVAVGRHLLHLQKTFGE